MPQFHMLRLINSPDGSDIEICEVCKLDPDDHFDRRAAHYEKQFDELVALVRDMIRYMEALIEDSEGEMIAAKNLVIRARALLDNLEQGST